MYVCCQSTTKKMTNLLSSSSSSSRRKSLGCRSQKCTQRQHLLLIGLMLLSSAIPTPTFAQTTSSPSFREQVLAKVVQGSYAPIPVGQTACLRATDRELVLVQDPCDPTDPWQRFQFVAVQTENVYQIVVEAKQTDTQQCVSVNTNDNLLEVQECAKSQWSPLATATHWSVVNGGRLQSVQTDRCVALVAEEEFSQQRTGVIGSGASTTFSSSWTTNTGRNTLLPPAIGTTSPGWTDTWNKLPSSSLSAAMTSPRIAVATDNCSSEGVDLVTSDAVVVLPAQPDDTLGPAPLVGAENQCLTSGTPFPQLTECRAGYHEDQRWELLQYRMSDNSNDIVYQVRSEESSTCVGIAENIINPPEQAAVTSNHLCVTTAAAAPTLLWRNIAQNDDSTVMILSLVQAPELCLTTSGEGSSSLALSSSGCTSRAGQFSFGLPSSQGGLMDWFGPSPLVRFDSRTCVNVNRRGLVTEEPCNPVEFEQQFRVARIMDTNDSTSVSFAIRSTATDSCLGITGDSSQLASRVVSKPCFLDSRSSSDNEDILWKISGQGSERKLSPHQNPGVCLTSEWIHRQTSTWTGWISFLGSFPTALLLGRRPVLGPCDERGAQNQFDAIDKGIDPWAGPIHTPIVASAMANRPDGTIIMWSTDLKVAEIKTDNRQTWVGVFDPDTGVVDEKLITEFEHDMFCPATVHLADGRLMVSGGSNNFKTTFYNPTLDRWEGGPDHILPRGYHSGTLRSDGSVFVVGGSWKDLDSIGGRDGALWTPATNQWQVLPGIKAEPLQTDDALGPYRSDNHMWLYEAPDGRIFHAGPAKRMHWISIESQTVTPSLLRGDSEDAMVGVSVMYDVGKIACFGGASSYDDTWSSARTYVVDINQNQPTVTRATDMGFRRAMHNAVALPDGDIVVVGGVEYAETFRDNYMVLTAELFNPDTLSFTQIPTPMKVPRNYHSSALLLKDGRVLAAGGGVCGRCPANHPDAEILTPPYLLDENGRLRTRPIIRSASTTTILPGNTVDVQMDTGSAHTFSLVRFGAATHSVNLDQRRVPLSIVSRFGSTFTVRTPSNVHVLLPGYYFLFAMNADGVPSIAETVFRPL